jgi:hypothetical protein
MQMDTAQEIEGLFIPASTDMARVLAEQFCKLFSDQQAEFLDHVATISGGWETDAVFQWRMMEDTITPKARALLQAMLDHTNHLREDPGT